MKTITLKAVAISNTADVEKIAPKTFAAFECYETTLSSNIPMYRSWGCKFYVLNGELWTLLKTGRGETHLGRVTLHGCLDTIAMHGVFIEESEDGAGIVVTDANQKVSKTAQCRQNAVRLGLSFLGNDEYTHLNSFA